MTTQDDERTASATDRPSGSGGSAADHAQARSRADAGGRNSQGTHQSTQQSSGQTNNGGASDFSSKTAETIDDAKAAVKDATGRAKEQGRAMFDEQKDSAAGTVNSAAHAFRNTAQQLQGEGQSQTGEYVAMFADRLESFGAQLRTKNLDSLIRDAEEFGRRSPATFIVGSMIAGFALSRFLKSSAQHRQEPMSKPDRQVDRTTERNTREDAARTERGTADADAAFRPARADGGVLLGEKPSDLENSSTQSNLSETLSGAGDTGPGMAGNTTSNHDISSASFTADVKPVGAAAGIQPAQTSFTAGGSNDDNR